MSEDDDEYQYEYVNNTSNCKYAIYAVDAPPDEIAFNGKCFVYDKPDEFFSNKAFVSEILNNPTYMDLLKICDKQIEESNDFHHIFFEGIHIIKKISDNVTQIELILCS